METIAMNDLRERLTDVAQQIATLEEKASTALHDNKNEEEYRAIMREKAELLASLEEACAPLVARLPQNDQSEAIGEALAQFSQSASNALSLNSVFYMSALLFPEDHSEGTPNDLELFIEQSLR